jgi:tetratricopeptide (TPR) repeat protein
LKSGGIFCQWIPLVAISPESYNTILNTIHQIFPHIALFSFFGESVVLASNEPISIEWEELQRRFHSPSVYEDFKVLDFQNPFNLIAFFLGGEHQIDEYLKDVRIINTDDNVWIEHRIPVDMLDLSHGNLYFMLRSKIKDDHRTSLKQIFSGIPLKRLDDELAALSKDGDLSYEKAERAKQSKDYTAMEEYYRVAFSDFNSESCYPAGLKLANYLESEYRIEEALPITKTLQKNFPAFPDAYQLEAQIMIKVGRLQKAKDTLNRGLMYNPNHPILLELLNKM